MKANKFIFCAVLSFLAASTSPDLILNNQFRGRIPASDDTSTKENEEKQKDEPKIESSLCKSESKGDKLAADVKDLIKDKEEIIDKVDSKKEKKKSKAKSVAESESSESTGSENSAIVALLSQITTMLDQQMQDQMQMQIQMMNMFSQMSANSYAPSIFSEVRPAQNFDLSGSGIGIPAQITPVYLNPFSTNQSPRVFDFYQQSPLEERTFQSLPRMQQEDISLNTDVIAV